MLHSGELIMRSLSSLDYRDGESFHTREVFSFTCEIFNIFKLNNSLACFWAPRGATLQSKNTLNVVISSILSERSDDQFLQWQIQAEVSFFSCQSAY